MTMAYQSLISRAPVKTEIAKGDLMIDMFAKAMDGWQPRTRGELGDAFPLLEAVYKHDDRLHVLVRQCLQILLRQNG
jgi:hypothetical protein